MGTDTFRGERALLAAAIAAMVVLPIALAGANGPEASTSASAKKQIKGLKKRVAALEGRETLPPSGPAGGDLTGTYPGPEFRANSVGPQEVAADSVGSSEIKGLTSAFGQGVEIDPGESAEATVTCPPGQMVVGGGFEWAQAPNGAIIKHSAPSFVGDANTTWVVRGQVFAPGLTNTLFAQANCLAV